MVVEPASPCRIRYRKRRENLDETPAAKVSPVSEASEGTIARAQIVVDMDLCKGHATCQGEAPGLFKVDEDGRLTVLNAYPDAGAIEKARAAARYCPTQAIQILGDTK